MPISPALSHAWRAFWRGLAAPLFKRVGALWTVLVIIHQVFHYAIAFDLRASQLAAQTPPVHALTLVVCLMLWATFSVSSVRTLLYTRQSHTMVWLWQQPLSRWHWSVLLCSLMWIWNAPLAILALLVRDASTPAVLIATMMCAAPLGVVMASRGWHKWLYLSAILLVVGVVAWLGQAHRMLWWANAAVIVPAGFLATGRLYESLRGGSDVGALSSGRRGRRWWDRSAVSALLWRDLTLSWRIAPGTFGMVGMMWLPCAGLGFAMWRHGHELDFMMWLGVVLASVPMAYMGKVLRERVGDGVFYNGTWSISVPQRFFAWQGMMCLPTVLYVAWMMPLWWLKPATCAVPTLLAMTILQLALGSVHGVAVCASSDRVTLRTMFVLLALALCGWRINPWSVGVCVIVAILASVMCVRRLESLRDGA